VGHISDALTPTNMEDTWQGLEYWVERPRIAAEIPTHETGLLNTAGAAPDHDRQRPICRATVHIKVRLRTHAGLGTKNVRVPHWQDDDIPCFQMNGRYRSLQQFRPAAA